MCAVTAAQLQVRFNSEGASRVKGDLESVGNAVDNVGRKSSSLGKSFANIGGGMSSLGSSLSGFSGIKELIGFTGITAPVVGGLGKMTFMASDLGEAMNKTNVVFGSSAGDITSWADQSADAFGISESAALSQASTFGNLFTGMGLSQEAAAGMSTEMLGLAADLASFNNVPVGEALAAIQSGLVGEAEPMRQFGVLLNESTVAAKAMEMGLGDATGVLSEQEKVLARNALIMEQTTNAQGDFARTSTGLANTQRILGANLAGIGATIGGVLLPAVTTGAQGVLGFLNVLGDLGRPFQVGAVAVGLFAAALGPALLIAGQLVQSFAVVRGAMAGFGARAGAVFARLGPLILRLINPIRLVAAAFRLLIGANPILLALTAGVIAFQTNFLGFGDLVRSVVSGAMGFLDRLTSAFSTLRSMGMDPVSAALGALSMALKGINGDNTPGWIVGIAKGLENAIGFIERFRDAWDSLDGISDVMEQVNDWGGIKEAARPLQQIARAFRALSIASEDFSGVASVLPGIFSGIANAASFVDRHFSTIARSVAVAAGAFLAFKIVVGTIALVAGAIGLLLSPIGLVIAGVVLLATAWTQNWGDIQGKTAAVVNFLQGSVWPVITAGINAVIDAWNLFKAAWDVGGLTGVGGALVGIITTIARNAMDAVLSGIQSLSDRAHGAIQGLVDRMFGAIQGLSDRALGALQDLADSIALNLQLAWDAITSLTWSDFIPDVAWSAFVTVLSWIDYVRDLVWDGFVTAVDLARKVGAFAWGVFVTAVDLAAKVGAFAWSAFITAVDLAKKVGTFAWGVFITGVDLAQKVGAFAWSAFVTAVDLAAKVGSFAWSIFVTGVDLAAKVGKFAWSMFVTAVDLAAKVGAFAWGTFVTGVNLAAKVLDLAWSTFVDVMPAWSEFVPDIKWGDYLPSKQEILDAITGVLPGGGNQEGSAEEKARSRDARDGSYGGGGSTKGDRFAGAGLMERLGGGGGMGTFAGHGDVLAGLQSTTASIRTEVAKWGAIVYGAAGSMRTAGSAVGTAAAAGVRSGMTTASASILAAAASWGASVFSAAGSMRAAGRAAGVAAGTAARSGVAAATPSIRAAAASWAAAVFGISGAMRAAGRAAGVASGAGARSGVTSATASIRGGAMGWAAAIAGTSGSARAAGRAVGTAAGAAARSAVASATGSIRSAALSWAAAMYGISGSMRSAGRAAGVAAGAGVVSGLRSQIGAVQAAASAIARAAIVRVGSVFDNRSPSHVMAGIGAYAAEGLSVGILSGERSVTGAAVSVVSNAIAAARQAAGIASPARKMVPVGVSMDDGLAQGIVAGQSSVISAAVQTVQRAISAARAAAQGSGGLRGVYNDAARMFGRQRGSMDGAIINGWERLTDGFWKSVRTGIVRKGILAEDRSYVNPGFYAHGMSAGTAFGNGVAAGARRSLQIHSPSRVLAQMGVYSAQGFTKGFERAYTSPHLGFAIDRPSVSMPARGRHNGSSGQTVIHNHVTVHVAGNVTAEDDLTLTIVRAVNTGMVAGRQQQDRAMGVV